MLYLTHSSYTLIGVLHYGALSLLRIPLQPLLFELQDAVKLQLLGQSPAVPTSFDTRPFPWQRAGIRLLGLTIFIALPAGIWYSAISLTTMTSLTALYNLNAFWAYIFSIYYSKQEKWELRSAMSVGIACLGVLVMTYGDSKGEGGATAGPGAAELAVTAATASVMSVGSLTARTLPQSAVDQVNTHGSVLGDLLGLISSLACGFYEVRVTQRFPLLPTIPVPWS